MSFAAISSSPYDVTAAHRRQAQYSTIHAQHRRGIVERRVRQCSDR
jgi:hypothetical protein